MIAEIKQKEAEAKQKEAEHQKEKAILEQKEATTQQLLAETENAILRLQMNPHFIFNSMNSISSYILEKDIDTANEYLTRFAKLMRSILKLAARPFITIEEEVALLKQYIATEEMRLENKFKYDFNIDPSIDCLLYTSPSPRDATLSRMPSSA